MKIVTVFAWLALATAVRADSLPAGFTPSMLNASIAPVVEAGAVTFHIIPGDCSSMDYGNGSAENDCLNGGTKNIMRYESEARLGDTVEYKFDVWVDPAFSYNGFSQAETIPFGGLGWTAGCALPAGRDHSARTLSTC